MLQLSVELGLFKAIDDEDERRWTVAELADVVGADATLLCIRATSYLDVYTETGSDRVLRYLFTIGVVRENSDSTYSATVATRWLAMDAAENDVKRNNATNRAMFQTMPVILQRQQTQLAADSGSIQTPLSGSSPAQNLPDGAATSGFVAMMRARRERGRTWMDVLPLELLRLSGRDFGTARTNFVQIGCSPIGEQCRALRAGFPGVLGGMSLQVKEAVVGRFDRTELAGYGVELRVQDPDLEQPALGAKAYYTKNVLHDFLDEKCVSVLQHLRQACAADSLVLIDEMVLPTADSEHEQAQPGLRMLSYLTVMERTRLQWENLISRAGLRLKRIYTYDTELGDSVIVAVRA
ncbi:hypothetical protein LTR91_009836 [Friedmanniomyces endolithicus]|uniref:O-methyltransferase C-terminal domain-containing protein n=1 Tax=Friedmanniomyces endolithicus TaxID=329885 RepID=A0A4U0VDM2_9PEZI|nr:hypothetical protein LTS09_000621 [Friedmanniomyces endolithicus]KAK0346867.1 hypothetical protein LTR94_005143 [Friedmanniomyces endolithicus]KAK0799623.1 hypothetical protein LTR59_005992 [Friedmanniomyces endolithicus]KAK0800188.1 hypothetical protein LTR75_008982 [Friedmanniomyces endolithicus]KAK0805289.1 hypothetical protein LTR38_005497 [Friedmanniomyces endolithicus]